MNIADQKLGIRKDILEKRNALATEEISERSECIRKNLSILDAFVKSKIVLFYASHSSEVRTDEMMIEALLLRKVLLPRIDERQIVPTLIMDLDNLIPGYGDIREPISAPSVKISSIDCAIVPGIAFDALGNRLGTGMGFYDRFLKKSTHAVKIGLSFECQMVETIPHEEHDVRMDYVVTEKRIIDCRKIRS